MKKIFIFLFVAFTGAILTGCSQEDLEINEPTTENKDQGHYVSLDQALIRLMPFYNEAAGTTRSSVLPLVTNLERLPVRNQTRSSEEVAPYYIVNFADNAGFAVLSADDRLLPVYAFSTSGHIALEDTVSNPTLSYFFNSLLQQEADNINAGGTLPNPWGPFEPGPGGIPPGDPVKPYEQFLVLVRPLLPGTVSTWNQEEPYNKYIPNSLYVGCAAISLGQICAFHGIPKSFPFTEKDSITKKDVTKMLKPYWPNLRDATPSNTLEIDTIAKFLFYLGSEDVLNLRYQEGITTLDSTEYSKFSENVKKLGYTKCTERDYNVQTAKEILTTNRLPFIVTSYFGNYISAGDDEEFVVVGNSGHMFVIDGIASYSSPTINCYYVHCVWGMSDTGDGYFYNPTSKPYTNILPPSYKDENGKDHPSDSETYTKLKKMFLIIP